MESNKVAQETLDEWNKKKGGFRPEQGGEEEAAMAAAAASPAATLAFLARPLSLLRHVAHGFAGYLAGLASRLKPAPAAAACQPLPRQEEEGKIQAAAVVIEEEEEEKEEVVVVQVRSRGMIPPQRPRGMTEGKVGSGGGYHH